MENDRIKLYINKVFTVFMFFHSKYNTVNKIWLSQILLDKNQFKNSKQVSILLITAQSAISRSVRGCQPTIYQML